MPQLELKELPGDLSEDQVVKPVALAKELGLKPQIVYGYIRNGGLQAYTKSGEGRYIIRDEFKAWLEAREQRKAERAARAAEKAAKKAKKAEEPTEEDGEEDYE